MVQHTPRLHLLCGKIASGKSTLAGKLAAEPAAVLIREDDWLSGLFGPEMASVQDYVLYSKRLRSVMAPHICALLRTGMSVVLDFPANTPDNRSWMREIIVEAQCDHTLHYLNVPENICKDRLRERNASGLHPFSVSDEQFAAISRHFVPPTAREGFQIKEY
jgi:predicted kinase